MCCKTSAEFSAEVFLSVMRRRSGRDDSFGNDRFGYKGQIHSAERMHSIQTGRRFFFRKNVESKWTWPDMYGIILSEKFVCFEKRLRQGVEKRAVFPLECFRKPGKAIERVSRFGNIVCGFDAGKSSAGTSLLHYPQQEASSGSGGKAPMDF